MKVWSKAYRIGGVSRSHGTSLRGRVHMPSFTALPTSVVSCIAEHDAPGSSPASSIHHPEKRYICFLTSAPTSKTLSIPSWNMLGNDPAPRPPFGISFGLFDRPGRPLAEVLATDPVAYRAIAEQNSITKYVAVSNRSRMTVPPASKRTLYLRIRPAGCDNRCALGLG